MGGLVLNVWNKISIASLLASFCLAAGVNAHAQESSYSKSFINQRAVQRVEQLFKGRRSSERTRRVVSSYSKRQGSLGDKLRLDSADSLIAKNRSNFDMYSRYRGVAYLSYVTDVVDVEELSEFENSAAAQKVLLFEGLRFSNEHVFKPLFGLWYDKIVRKLRTVRDYTTVGVVKDDAGSFGVQRGLTEDERLVEFKVHASARYGLEPRLRFDDNLVLRYRPLEQETLFEFRIDF